MRISGWYKWTYPCSHRKGTRDSEGTAPPFLKLGGDSFSEDPIYPTEQNQGYPRTAGCVGLRAVPDIGQEKSLFRLSEMCDIC